MFEQYSDEALLDAHEAGMLIQVCNAASIDFQTLSEYNEKQSHFNV